MIFARLMSSHIRAIASDRRPVGQLVTSIVIMRRWVQPEAGAKIHLLIVAENLSPRFRIPRPVC